MNPMQYIVGFNGPPRSGKDSIAQAVRTLVDNDCTIPTHLDHLARPMRQMAMSLCGLDPNDFHLYTVEKDKPRKLLQSAATGHEDSIRRLMIRTSEEFIKPQYGQDFWGRKLVSDHPWLAAGLPGILFVPDIGFPAEVSVFDSLFPGVKTLIVQVTREDTTWVGDSRVRCEGQRNTAEIVNNGTILQAAEWLYDHMTRFMGWDFSCGN